MRSPPSRLERTLVLVLAGFIAVDLLLIVPAFASELRLDRLHPSLPIVNLHPLAAGRARIADGLGEEIVAPVRALAGELEQAGAMALNAILYKEDATHGNPAEATERTTNANNEGNDSAGVALVPSATPYPGANNTSTENNTPLPSPTVDSLETSVVQTATSLALPPKTKTPAPTSTQIPSYTPTSPVVPTEQIPPITPTKVAFITATVVCSALTTSACQPTPNPTSTPTAIATSTATATLPQEGRQTYYVATNGSDNNAGTEAQPFRTIKNGISILGPGDVLYVRGGTFVESLEAFPSGESWINPVTLVAYPGEDVTLRPSSGSDVLAFANAQYIVVDGFHLDGTYVQYNVINISAGAHHIRIENTEVSGAPRQGILSSIHNPDLSGHNEFINLNVHDNGTTDFDHGLYIETSNNVIHRSRIHHNAGWGVHIYREGCNDCANFNVVNGNALYQNAAVGDRGSGIILSSGVGNLAYNNLVWGNSGGIQVDDGTPDAMVYNNVVYENDKFGIEIQSGSTNTIVMNNIVYRNGGVPISDAGHGTRLDYNLTETDPQFVDASAHDFHLLPGSRAIDAGITLNAVRDDFDGIQRPRGTGFDIGAYESPFSSR